MVKRCSTMSCAICFRYSFFLFIIEIYSKPPSPRCREVKLNLCHAIFYAHLTHTVKFAILQHANGYLFSLSC